MSARERLSRIRARAGSKGGKATAKKGEEFRSSRAQKGGIAFLEKYGVEALSYQLGRRVTNN